MYIYINPYPNPTPHWLILQVIVVAAAMQKREKYQRFLTQVPLLETLSEFEIMTLADSLAEETYVQMISFCLTVHFSKSYSV